MSTLDDLNAGPGGMAGFVSALSRRLRPVSRRDVLVGATVAATALATKPREYALTPVAAYATICGPGNTASSGWTVFCATVNKGVNTCPPGSFAAGWWKAADSSWCGGGYRYIVDCNASCSKCTTGCSDNMCDSRCWSCSCGTGSTATCDQRRVCCNAFRYGQCNTQIKCSGGVHCRVVSCRAPYEWTSCTTTSLVDNRTSEHSAPSLPQWGVIAQKYGAMGSQASFLKASTGPVRYVGDGHGSYVLFQGGVIYHKAATGAVSMNNFIRSQYALNGGPLGTQLGYPIADRAAGLKDGGWIQVFERGCIVDSQSTATQCVWGIRWDVWQRMGRENGAMGYPTGPKTSSVQGGWYQLFQTGAIADSSTTATTIVVGDSYRKWRMLARERGPLGYPLRAEFPASQNGWIQLFQTGATCGGPVPVEAVPSPMFEAWTAAGRDTGQLAYPTGPHHTTARGTAQFFQGGQLWSLGGATPRLVYGDVLTQWQAAGGASGGYGYPLTDTVEAGGGRLTCRFEGGTITA